MVNSISSKRRKFLLFSFLVAVNGFRNLGRKKIDMQEEVLRYKEKKVINKSKEKVGPKNKSVKRKKKWAPRTKCKNSIIVIQRC